MSTDLKYGFLITSMVAILADFLVRFRSDQWTVYEFLKLGLLTSVIVVLAQLQKEKRRQPQTTGDELPSRESTLKLIKERRSIMPKDLNGEKVSSKDIEFILEAANWAPTHHRTEPWRYTVVSGYDNLVNYLEFHCNWYSDHREDIPDKDYEQFNKKYEQMTREVPEKASHLIVICMKRQANPEKLLPEWEEVCATACSVQNLHLALTSLPGLGGFWSSHTWCKHSRDSKEFKKHLGLEEEDKVFGAFILGKVSSNKRFRSARGDWKSKITWRSTCEDEQ